jgi:hypothetical protein
VRIPLSTGDYLVDGQRAINLYPVFNSAKKQIEFLGTEGLTLRATIGGAAIRGLYVTTNDDTKMYAVAGNKFYKILTNWTYSENAQPLNSASGLVEFSDNGTEITITDGTDGYVYTIATDVLAEIADLDFPGGGSNTFLDGYTVVCKPNTQQVNSSALYNSAAWDALDFASAEGLPDNVLRCITYNRQLVLFGIVTTEIFYNSGATGFPFDRIAGAVIEYGLSAKNSVAKNDLAVYFLARSTAAQGERVIVEARSMTPHIVSTQGVNELLATLTNTADAEGFAYMREGHSFYELTFPTDNVTIVYDAKEKSFHERKSVDANGSDIRHRARCYAYFNGHHVVGDFETGNIYTLDSDVFTENGSMIKRKLITPDATDLQSNGKFPIPELIVPMKTGVGLANGQGSDPMLMMRYSKDKAKTWSNEKQTSFGKIGKYDKRVRFRNLGQFRHVNVELSVSDPVEVYFEGPLMVPR